MLIGSPEPTAHFLPFYKRLFLLNPLNRGLIIDGRNALPKALSYQHLLLVAPSGFGKTTRYVINNALQLDGKSSAVFTDPSGEIFNTCAPFLKRKGYHIKCLDLRPHQSRLQYNPFYRIQTSSDANKMAHILLNAAYPNNKGDTFWIDGAKALINILILYLIQRDQNSTPTLLDLYQLLFQLSYNPKECSSSFLQHLTPLQKAHYQAFCAQDSKIIAGTLSTCKAALHMLADPHVQYITQRESLHFEQIRERPTALFIIVAEQDIHYFQFLLSLFYSQLFRTCLHFETPNKAFLPIRFFLDEFGNMNIPNFPSYITVLRKYKVSVSIIIQELEQLYFQYQQQAQTIIDGGCSHHLYYPGLGLDTCTKLEKILGYTRSDGRKPLMASDNIRTLDSNQALFISGNKRPILLKTRPWFKQRKLRKRGVFSKK